jgi:thiamine-phosphate pyrophosphorylase
MRMPERGLYALTPDGDDASALLDAVEAAITGGAVMVQFRQKGLAPAIARSRAERLLAVCRGRGVPLVVNDDLELAAAIGADGVHLGREDPAVAEARRRLGPDAIVGASCYDSLALARAAAAAGASYLAFGSVFASSTKPQATRVSLDTIRAAAREFALPICAIGGITAGNAAPVIAAGAGLLAVISAVFAEPDPRAAAARFRALF